MVLGSTYGETAWAECESVIRRFEDAWRGQERPDIGAHIISDSPHTVRLLVELVHIDLEFRLRADEFARAEDYLTRFPQLCEPEIILDLLAAEFALRNRHSPPAWPEEFWLRFPEHMAAFRARIPADGGTGWYAATRPAERPGAPLAGPPIIAGYEIQGELGRGGMGVVYKARDLLLHRTVAIKTFATVPRPESCARFAREAEAIARLDHPHIVPVYEVGEWHAADGGPSVPFFVMKWYPGGSMDAAPAGPGTDTAKHARTVETIARAVHHAHQRGVLHRDLKPSNILLDEAGLPHVADFGLAGRVDPQAPTVTAVVAGTPAYMAPEQARTPKQVSTAADVYGLGAILYHQLTGQAPFAADTPLATLDLVANTVPNRPSALNPAVPRDLDTICLKCLEKHPARRYASAAEVADDLERWRKGLPIAARPARAWELAWRRVRRHPFVTALIVITAGALVGAVAVLADSNDRIRQKEKETKDAYLRECAMRYKLEEALTRDTAMRTELEGTLRREQRALYLERVASAGRLYTANQLAQAWALLDQCPEAYRGWEWRYLDSLRQEPTVALTGHKVLVQRASFLPDGRLVSGDALGVVRVWDVPGRKCEREWTFSREAVLALATHPKLNWIAVADMRGVTVRDADTGREVAALPGTHWVAFSSDGTRAATADKTSIRLWIVPDAEPKAAAAGGKAPPKWQPAGELTGHIAQVVTGVFAPDGRQLITTANDRTIRTWDLEAGKQIGNRSAPTIVTGLSLAASGRILVESHIGAVVFTDTKTGETLDRLECPSGERTAIATGPDQRSVAVSGPAGEVWVWDIGRRRIARVYRGHSRRVVGFAFGPGRRLVSCGDQVRVWDLEREQGVRTLAWVSDGEGGLAVSPDGLRVAVGPRFAAGAAEPNGMVIDAQTGRELHRFPAGPGVAFHTPTGRLVSMRARGGVTLWDAPDRPVWSKPFPDTPDSPQPSTPGGRSLVLSPDGQQVAVWNKTAKCVHLLNIHDGTPIGSFPAGGYVYNLAFAPGGARLAAATTEGLKMWDVASRTDVPWTGERLDVTALAFSPDGRWVAAVEKDYAVRLRDAATGVAVRQFAGTSPRVVSLLFSPDSTRLVTGGADRTVSLWDVESGRELLSLAGVTEGVTGLAWDARNDRIYALDFAVRVWGTK